jgi:hypothetical protein
MRTPKKIALFFIVILMAGLLSTGCANDQNQAIAQTMAVLTQQAMSLPVITFTPEPTLPPTETLIPSETPTITPTPTPDYTNFSKVTPAPATVNAAAFQGVNFKFVKSEISATSKPMDPNSTTGKETEYDHGKATANLYFMADVSGLYKTVISNSTYVIVTFSDGEKETILEGWEKTGGALKGFYASEKADTVGEVDFAFSIPKEGMQIVKLMVAANKSVKDKAVVLYQK